MDPITKLYKKVNNLNVLYIATFLFLIVFVSYVNTFFNQLFFDDEDFIYNNIYVKNFSITDYFTKNLIAGAGKVSNYYRPLLLLSYGIETKLFGVSSFIYHFDNFVFHFLSGLLLFLILKKLFKSNIVPLLTSTLFLIHPIQTEAVSYASGRGDPLSVFFIFLSILFYLKGKKAGILLSTLFFLAALLSKESAIITPGLIIAIELYKNPNLKKLLPKLYKLLPIIVVGLAYFFLRITILNFQNTLNFYNGWNIYSSNLLYRLLTFLSVIPVYIGLMFFPKTLYIERTALVITSLLNPYVIVTVAVLSVLLFFAVKSSQKQPVFLLGILWFFIAILPFSGIIPINGIIYEHFLYLPVVGIFLIFACCINIILAKVESYSIRVFIVGFLLISIAVLVIRTQNRNNEWHDPVTFYTQTLQYSPNSINLHNNLGMALADEGKSKQAIEEYKKAIALGDFYPQTHFNLGNSYLGINDLKDAEMEYNKTIKMDPGFIKAYINLVQIYKLTSERARFKNLMLELSTYGHGSPEIKMLINNLRIYYDQKN